MKFLGGIHKYHLQEDKIRFTVPVFHRTALGLIPGEVKIYALPKKTIKNGVEVKEIIFSPFKPSDWEHLWKIELTTEDRPGILRDVTEIISKNDINISIQESSIESYNKDFSITLFLDCKSFVEKNKLLDIPLVEKKDKIIAKLSSDYQSQGYKGFKIVRFEPIEFLNVNCPKNNTSRENLISSNTLKDYDNSDMFLDIEDKGVIVLKDSILKDLGVFSDKTPKVLEGTTFSDTEEKYLILRFFGKEQYVINIDVVHKDRVGMINSFTKKILEIDEGFNLINCYNRIENVRHIAHWYSLIDVTSKPEEIKHLINILKADDSEVQEVRILNYTNNIEDLYVDIPDSIEIYRKKQEKKEKQAQIDKLSEAIGFSIPKLQSDLINLEEQTQSIKIENTRLLKELENNKHYNDYQDKMITTSRYLIGSLLLAIIVFNLDKLNELKTELYNNKNFDFLGKVGDVIGLFAALYTLFKIAQLYFKKPFKE